MYAKDDEHFTRTITKVSLASESVHGLADNTPGAVKEVIKIGCAVDSVKVVSITVFASVDVGWDHAWETVVELNDKEP